LLAILYENVPALFMNNEIVKKKKHAYIAKRWRLVAGLLKAVPDWLYNKT
jgi:hypothetical protein